MFTFLEHFIHDFGLFFSFLLNQVMYLIGIFLTPFYSAYFAFSGFLFGIQSNVQADYIIISDNTKLLLENIPYWNTLSLTIGAGVLFIIGHSIIRSFQKI